VCSSDLTLDEPVHKLALQIANSRKWEDAEKLNRESWEAVYKWGQAVEVYRAALEKAEKVIRMEPNNPYIPPRMSAITLGAAQYRVGKYEDAIKTLTKADYLEPNLSAILTWLGAAQYRAGAYEDALKTFTRSEKIRADAHLGPDPDVAFIAMSLHQLGRADEAKAALEQLRSLCKEERFAEDQEAQAFLAEAEKLIEGGK
jgi:tetratricopeptide (TPR) repeat protein